MANIEIFGTLIRNDNSTNRDKIVEGSQVAGGYFVCEILPAIGNWRNGQLCYCQEDSKFYQYNGENWIEAEFGSDLPLSKVGESNSIIQINADETKNPQAIGDNSIAFGEKTIAGLRGFNILRCELLSGTEEEKSGYYYLSSDISGIEVGDQFSVRIYNNYINIGTVEAIDTDANRILVNNFVEFYTGTDTTTNEEYFWVWNKAETSEIRISADGIWFWIVSKPYLGDISIGSGSAAFGIETKAVGNTSIAAGYGTEAIGRYSVAIGNSTQAYHAGFAQGVSTIAKGDYSAAFGNQSKAEGLHTIAGGLKSEATGDNSIALGNNLKAHSSDQAVLGAFNVPESEAALVVGAGSSAGRKNALTVFKDGTIRGNNLNPKTSHDLVPLGFLKEHYVPKDDIYTTLDVSDGNVSWINNIKPGNLYVKTTPRKRVSIFGQNRINIDLALNSQNSMTADGLTAQKQSNGYIKFTGTPSAGTMFPIYVGTAMRQIAVDPYYDDQFLTISILRTDESLTRNMTLRFRGYTAASVSNNYLAIKLDNIRESLTFDFANNTYQIDSGESKPLAEAKYNNNSVDEFSQINYWGIYLARTSNTQTNETLAVISEPNPGTISDYTPGFFECVVTDVNGEATFKVNRDNLYVSAETKDTMHVSYQYDRLNNYYTKSQVESLIAKAISDALSYRSLENTSI